MEYEHLKIAEPHVGMLLALKPPIEIRKGILVLKKDSVTVLYE
jgi:hypothetical protein